MIGEDFRAAAVRILELCRTRKLKLATAESCTGGLIAAALTEISGSSDVLERGWVTYSNAAKEQDLGVPTETLRRFGAVSAEVARAMAEGAIKKSGVDLALAVTGIAGPTGGTVDKPIGLVHIAASGPRGTLTRELHLGDIGRSEVRRQSVLAAFALLIQLAGAS
jgi:nicotinamide-nucleotide amidase